MRRRAFFVPALLVVCAATLLALRPPLGVSGPMSGTWTLRGKQIEYDTEGSISKQAIDSQLVLSDDSGGEVSALSGTLDGLAVSGVRHGTGFVLTGSDGSGDQLVVSGQIQTKNGLARRLSGEFTHYDEDDITRARIRGRRAD